MMISVVLSMIVVLGSINLYISIIGSGKNINQRNRLTEELRAIAGTVTKDVRRAGYWAADPNTDDLWENPFTTGSNDLTLDELVGEAGNSCVLYSYDLNIDGDVDDGSVDPNERFGFRLNDGAVQMFTTGTLSCNDGTWETITTPDLTISALAFSLSQTCIDIGTEAVEACPCASGDTCQHVRRVNVSLTGQLANDANVTESLVESIRLRNDKFVEVVP
jgi:prepilin peptidase dependent protein B